MKKKGAQIDFCICSLPAFSLLFLSSSSLPLCSLPFFSVFLIQTSKPGHLHHLDRWQWETGKKTQNWGWDFVLSQPSLHSSSLGWAFGFRLSLGQHSFIRLEKPRAFFFFHSEGKTQRKVGFFGYIIRSWVCRGWGRVARSWSTMGGGVFYFCYVDFLWLVNENVWY